MTPTQHKVYDFIRDFIMYREYSPSYQQIADGVGMKSKGQVYETVKALVAHGVIRTKGNRRYRSIELVDDERDKLIEEMYEALKKSIDVFDDKSPFTFGGIETMRKAKEKAEKHIRRKALSDMAERDADLILKGY